MLNRKFLVTWKIASDRRVLLKFSSRVAIDERSDMEPQYCSFDGSFHYRQSGLHKVGETTQDLEFKYHYKSHRKSYELLWAFKEHHII